MERMGIVWDFLSPVLIAAILGAGTWGLWISKGVYDAQRHIGEYNKVIGELKEATIRISSVEDTVIEMRSLDRVQDQAQMLLLSQILQEVRAK